MVSWYAVRFYWSAFVQIGERAVFVRVLFGVLFFRCRGSVAVMDPNPV